MGFLSRKSWTLSEDSASKPKYTGYTCLRYCLCISNILFWVIGSGVLAIGIWLRITYGSYAVILPSVPVLSADILCMMAGGITFLVALCGSCGACLNNKGCLITYFVLVLLIFILEVSAGIVAFVFRDQVNDVLMTELRAGVKDYGTPEADPGLEASWDHIQAKFECCGIEGPADWYSIRAWPHIKKLPPSCCGYTAETSVQVQCGTVGSKENYYQRGCFEIARTWTVQNLLIVGVVLISFAFIQLFGVVASLLMACTVRARRNMR